MSNYELIAISGKAGTGKDFIYENFLRPAGFHRWALADHFKIWLAGKGTWSYEDVFYHKPPACRSDLQQEGTERGRNVYGENIWCQTTLMWLRLLHEQWGIQKYVITDVRFPNEVDFVRANGGKVFRIVAPKRAANSKLSDQAKQHISETALDSYTNFDGFIYNDPEHSETVGTQIAGLLGQSTEIDATAWDGFNEMFEKFDGMFDKMNDTMDSVFGKKKKK